MILPRPAGGEAGCTFHIRCFDLVVIVTLHREAWELVCL